MYATKKLEMKFLFSSYWMGYTSAIVGWLVSFLMPISHFLLIVVAMVFFDMFTGTRAAKARKEK